MNSPFLVQYRVIEEDINDTTALGTGRTDNSDDLFIRHSDVGLNRLILTYNTRSKDDMVIFMEALVLL